MSKNRWIILVIFVSVLLTVVPLQIDAQEETLEPVKKVAVELNLLGPLFFGVYEVSVEVRLLDMLSLGFTPLFYHSELVVLYRLFAAASSRQLWYTGAKLGSSFYPQKKGVAGVGFGVYINTVYYRAAVPVWSGVSSGVALGPGAVVSYRSALNLFSISLKSELQYLFLLGLSVLEHAEVRADYPALVGLRLYIGVGIGLAF